MSAEILSPKGGQVSNKGQGSGTNRGTGRLSGRQLQVQVKAGRGMTISSRRWLNRQLNDPYVAEARRQGWRSRAAFKLIQLDDRFHLLRPGSRVVDLGAAPGGWTQVAVRRTGGGRVPTSVIALDLQSMEPIAGAQIIQEDFLDPAVIERLKYLLGGPVDLVLSDMAAPATGHTPTDHIRIMALAESAHAFARDVLREGGTFVAKVLQGGTEHHLLNAIKQDFSSVRHAKPAASRADSAETYLVAKGFRRHNPASPGPFA